MTKQKAFEIFIYCWTWLWYRDIKISIPKSGFAYEIDEIKKSNNILWKIGFFDKMLRHIIAYKLNKSKEKARLIIDKALEAMK